MIKLLGRSGITGQEFTNETTSKGGLNTLKQYLAQLPTSDSMALINSIVPTPATGNVDRLLYTEPGRKNFLYSLATNAIGGSSVISSMKTESDNGGVIGNVEMDNNTKIALSAYYEAAIVAKEKLSAIAENGENVLQSMISAFDILQRILLPDPNMGPDQKHERIALVFKALGYDVATNPELMNDINKVVLLFGSNQINPLDALYGAAVMNLVASDLMGLNQGRYSGEIEHNFSRCIEAFTQALSNTSNQQPFLVPVVKGFADKVETDALTTLANEGRITHESIYGLKRNNGGAVALMAADIYRPLDYNTAANTLNGVSTLLVTPTTTNVDMNAYNNMQKNNMAIAANQTVAVANAMVDYHRNGLQGNPFDIAANVTGVVNTGVIPNVASTPIINNANTTQLNVYGQPVTNNNNHAGMHVVGSGLGTIQNIPNTNNQSNFLNQNYAVNNNVGVQGVQVVTAPMVNNMTNMAAAALANQNANVNTGYVMNNANVGYPNNITYVTQQPAQTVVTNAVTYSNTPIVSANTQQTDNSQNYLLSRIGLFPSTNTGTQVTQTQPTAVTYQTYTPNFGNANVTVAPNTTVVGSTNAGILSGLGNNPVINPGYGSNVVYGR